MPSAKSFLFSTYIWWNLLYHLINWWSTQTIVLPLHWFLNVNKRFYWIRTEFFSSKFTEKREQRNELFINVIILMTWSRIHTFWAVILIVRVILILWVSAMCVLKKPILPNNRVVSIKRLMMVQIKHKRKN